MVLAASDTIGSHSMKLLMPEMEKQFCRGKKKERKKKKMPVFQVSTIFAVFFFFFDPYSWVALFTVHPKLLDPKERLLMISLKISKYLSHRHTLSELCPRPKSTGACCSKEEGRP